MAPQDHPGLVITMANGMDRLEKLFSKKKHASSRSTTGVNRSPGEAPFPAGPDAFIPQFPQPSFIRPKGSKMVARDESRSGRRGSSGRARSLPDSTVGDPDTTYTRDTVSLDSDHDGAYGPRIPRRPSPIVDRRDPLVASLHSFRFQHGSRPRQDEPDVSPTGRRPKELPPRLDLDLAPMSLPSRVDTPPPSDQDEPMRRRGLGPALPLPSLGNNPTPEHSPGLPPGEPRTGSARSSQDLQRIPPLRREPGRRSPARPSTPPGAMPDADPILKEPNFGDFLQLSDDDIAETRPATPVRPNEPPAALRLKASPAPTIRSLRARAVPSTPPQHTAPAAPSTPASPSTAALPLLPSALARGATVSPLANQSATIAAFQVARIAHKHNFDLVYVVNLWPKGMAIADAKTPWNADSPPGTPTQASYGKSGAHSESEIRGSGSFARMSPRSPLAGRFLAAYGLATVKPPFHLSGETHSKVLNADRWLEFRERNAAEDEFARGYGCAFYTGRTPVSRRPSQTAWDADNEAGGDDSDPGRATPRALERQDFSVQDKAPKNRGIAFVAYRRTRADGGDTGSSPDALDELHRDAEALVEFILDMHTMNRRREQLAALRAARQIADPLEPSTPNA